MKKSTNFCFTAVRNYHRKSFVKIYRKTENGWKVIDNAKNNNGIEVASKHEQHKQTPNQTQNDEIKAESGEVHDVPEVNENVRLNEMKIQMLSKSLYDQIFKNNAKKAQNVQTIKR